DFWQGGRTNGHISPNSKFWWLTNGSLASLIHSKGCKLILYTQPEAETSALNTGSGGYSTAVTNSHGEFPSGQPDYIAEDAADFVAWGVDGIKFDPQSNDFQWRVHQVR